MGRSESFEPFVPPRELELTVCSLLSTFQIQTMTFAELDQEVRNELEDIGIEAVPSTWNETKEWVESCTV